MLFKKQIETHLYNEIHSDRERENKFSVPSLQF